METTYNARRLTTTSYALLAQLALKPWPAYELVQQRVRYFRYVWPKAESAIYREIKKLADDGLAITTTEHTGRRPRFLRSQIERLEDRLALSGITGTLADKTGVVWVGVNDAWNRQTATRFHTKA